MQPQLYIGGAGTGKTTACFAEIERILQDHPDHQIIVLVPDPATYMMERKLAEYRQEKGFTTVRVVGMTRLAYQVYQSLGKVKEEGLSEIGKKLVLRVLLKQSAGELDLFKQAAKQPHFGDVIQGLLTECKAFGVTPEDLSGAVKHVDSMVLGRKLQELSLLLERYDAALEELGVQDSMETLIEILPQSPLMQGCHVFVDGFHWFTPLQHRLIQRLFSLSESCHMTISLPSLEEEVHSRKGSMYFRVWETYRDMMTWYPEAVVHDMNTVYRGTPVLQQLNTQFFKTPMKANTTEDSLTMVSAYNREREADAVCRKILAYRQEEEHRWKDCTIILRDMESYGDVLEKACMNYGIPFFSDQRKMMTSHPLAEFLQGIFHVHRTFFDHDAVFRLLKTDFAPFTREEVDRLENYCLEYGIQGAAWLRDVWTYGGEDDEERRAVMQDLHMRVLEYLRPIYDFCKLSHTGQEWSEFLFQIMQDWHIPEQLKYWYDEAEDRGDVQESASHVQIYKHAIQLLEECAAVTGTEELNAEEMGLIIEEGLSEVTYSLVPPSLDHVTITTIDRSYMTDAKEVYVLGLNEGVFPRKMGDEGILRDQERTALAKVGVQLAAGALGQMFNENFLFYLACTRASQGLHLSYVTSDEEGSKMEPSLVVRRLQQYGYVKTFEEAPLSMPEGREQDYLWRPSQSLGLFSSRMSALMKGDSISSTWWSLYNWGIEMGYRGEVFFATRGMFDSNTVPRIEQSIVRGLLLRSDALTGSVTRLERYHRCPYSFYAQYALRLAPRKVKSFGAPEIGTFLHDTLRYLGEYLLEQGRQWRDLTEEEQESLCREAADAVMGTEERDAYEAQLYTRLTSTLSATIARLVDWSKKSEFSTTEIEQSFGMGTSNWHPVRIPLGKNYGESIVLRGQIDRVDEYRGPLGHYAAVIDYKSGGTTVRADEIYYGLKLQLMTYLLALEKNTQDRIGTAAALYTYVRNPQVKLSEVVNHRRAEEEKATIQELKNSGYFVDGDVLQSLDVTRAYQSNSPYVPIVLKKDGTPDSRTSKSLKTMEQFGLMKEYTKQIISNSGTQMMDGEFPISPYQKDKRPPCEYCEFQALCRFDGTRNRYRYIKTMTEEEALEKMEALQTGGATYEMD